MPRFIQFICSKCDTIFDVQVPFIPKGYDFEDHYIVGHCDPVCEEDLMCEDVLRDE